MNKKGIVARWLPNSLRWSLQLWLAMLLVSVLGGFGTAIYQLERTAQSKRVDDDLTLRIEALNTALRNAPFSHGPGSGPPPGEPGPDRPPMDGPGPERPHRPPPDEFEPPAFAPMTFGRPMDLPLSAATATLFGEGPGAFYYVTWYRDNELLSRSPGAPRDVPFPPRRQHDTLTHWQTRDGYREAFHCSGLGDCVLAGRSTTIDLAAMRSFALELFGAGGTVLALALGVGWWLTGRAIRPIEQISVAASRISRGDLSERVHVANDGDELGRLAAVLNSTFARLESAFERQRRFTADAAHELRTPLAIMISETQTALARRRNAEEYRETVEGCLDTAQQMRGLTESLLTLSRFDSGDSALARTGSATKVDLAEAAKSVMELLKPIAEKQRVRLRGDFAPAFAFSSAGPVSQVISNLLTNAIDYNRPDGDVLISTACDHTSAVIAVTDTGLGIPADDLPYIFDRFCRVDKSRSRAEGHAGLGLAISKAIVEAEGGTIQATSEFNVGTTVTIRLPAISGRRPSN